MSATALTNQLSLDPHIAVHESPTCCIQLKIFLFWISNMKLSSGNIHFLHSIFSFSLLLPVLFCSFILFYFHLLYSVTFWIYSKPPSLVPVCIMYLLIKDVHKRQSSNTLSSALWIPLTSFLTLLPPWLPQPNLEYFISYIPHTGNFCNQEYLSLSLSSFSFL
jgi:hypothetical protein